MSESHSHKATSNRIALKYNAKYNNGEGIDINSSIGAIEVETPETVGEAIGQLKGYRGPVYIAGTNKEAVKKALEVTKNTTIGVMDNQGVIVQLSTRKK